MIKYALTGNIASGKSTVEKILSSHGYKVLDTDVTAHYLLDNNPEIHQQFSDYDVFEDGKISRAKLGQLVFSNPVLKEKLEKIIHPLIKSEIENFFNANSEEKCVFVAIPLLFEAKMQNLFDKIILIYTEDDIRLERLIKRNNYAIEYARRRMNSQISQDKKVDLSDFVIYNNSTTASLEEQIFKIIE